MTIKNECDVCGMQGGIEEKTVCRDCYNDAMEQIDDLEDEIAELQEKIAELETIEEDLEKEKN